MTERASARHCGSRFVRHFSCTTALLYNSVVVYYLNVTPSPIRPMPLVVGGILALENIVGRDRETAAIMTALPTGGAVLVGDRRHGKTSLTHLAHNAARRAGHLTVRLSAERGTYKDFVEGLAEELTSQDSKIAKEVSKWRLTLGWGPLKAERSAKDSDLDKSLDSLIRCALPKSNGRMLVLFIDEVTVLAQALERGESGAGESFLHLLRRLRQENSGRLAIVLSGSIGFHHVTPGARGTVNDIPIVPVGPISSPDATYLARCLIRGSGVAVGDELSVATEVAAVTEGIPYYIQHLIKSARDVVEATHVPLTPHDIAPLLASAQNDPYDPWNLRHYRDRVKPYYGADADLVCVLLDIYAGAPAPLTVDEVLHLYRSTSSHPLERPRLVELVERLEQDHYLTRVNRRDQFSSNLVRGAWEAIRR